jgi:TetR/AcrR family fatty acid metabolism transcriptional regulator
LRTFARVHFEMVGESPQLAEVLTVELRQSGKFMRQADMRPFGRYLSIISRIVSDGIESGEFIADISPRMCARMLFGAIDELALEWAVGNRTSGIEDAYIQTVTVFLNGLTVRK